ncbi:MAG: hypothetical protein H7839_06260 [Magnetococcus sp. YQC-5]
MPGRGSVNKRANKTTVSRGGGVRSPVGPPTTNEDKVVIGRLTIEMTGISHENLSSQESWIILISGADANFFSEPSVFMKSEMNGYARFGSV